MVLRCGVSDERLHPFARGIVLAGCAPEIVVRELIFRFGVALIDPGLPEACDGVPVIGIERQFRFRQQLLAKSFLHRAILPPGLWTTQPQCPNRRSAGLRVDRR